MAILLHTVQNLVVQRFIPLHNAGSYYQRIGRKRLLYIILLAMLIPFHTVWAKTVEIDLRKYNYDPVKGIQVGIMERGSNVELMYMIVKGDLIVHTGTDLTILDDLVIIGDPATTYKGAIKVSAGIAGTGDLAGYPVKITLRNVKIKASEDLKERNAFHLDESRMLGTHVKLTLEGENYLEGTRGKENGDKMISQITGGAGIAVGYARKYEKDNWEEYDSKLACSLVIDGPGELTAIGGLGCAGIGGSGGSLGAKYAFQKNEEWRAGHYCGKITINGGTIKAYGDVAAAAIGDSYCGGRSEIIINGGDITAEPLPFEQRHDLAIGGITGIGGEKNERGFKVKITGGKIKASGMGAPAIGGGRLSQFAEQGREISISGNPDLDLKATNSPAMGLGWSSDKDASMNINISGGKIVAKGGYLHPAIGPSGTIVNDIKARGKIYINISGGDLTLTGGDSAPAIGRPSDAKAPTINITGNAKIDATGGYQAAAIGDGPYIFESDFLLLDDAATNVTISGNPKITAKGGALSAGIGGGYNAVNGKIAISGGDITAIGNHHYTIDGKLQRGGAGIGSGGINLEKKETNVIKEPGEIRIEGGNIVAQGGYLAAGIGGGGGFGTGNPAGKHIIHFTGGTVKASGYMVAGVGDGLGINPNSSGDTYDMISFNDYFDKDGLAEVYITGGNLIFNSYFKTDNDGNPTKFEAKDIKAAQGFPKNNKNESLYRAVVALLNKSGEWAAGKELGKETYKIPYNVAGITTGLAGEFYCYLPSTGHSVVPGSVFDTNSSQYRGTYQISPQKEKLNLVFLKEGKKLVINAYGKDIHIYKDSFKLADRDDILEDLSSYYYPSNEEYQIMGSDNQGTYIHIHEDYDGYEQGGSVKLMQYASSPRLKSAILAEASVKLEMNGDITLGIADGSFPAIHVTKNATVEISGDGCLAATGGWNAPAILAEGESQIKIKSGMLRLKGGENAPAVKSDTTVIIDGGSIQARHGSGSSTEAWEVAGLINSDNKPLTEVILKIPGNGLTIEIDNKYKYDQSPRWSSLQGDNNKEISGMYKYTGEKVLSFAPSPSTKSTDATIPQYNLEGIRLAEMETQDGTYLYPQYLYLPTADNETYRTVVGIGNEQHENTAKQDGNSQILYPIVHYTLELNGNTLAEDIQTTGTVGYNRIFIQLPDTTTNGDTLFWYTDKKLTRRWINRKTVNVQNGVVAGIDNGKYKCSITFYAVKKFSIEGSSLQMQSSDSIYYNKQEHKPSFTLTDKNGKDLTVDTDYTISYENNTQASDSAKIVVSGKGNYIGQTVFYFTIHPKQLTLENVTVKDKYRNDTPAGEIANQGNLNGICEGDEVSVDWSAAEILFSSTATTGNNIPVSLSGLTLAGAAKDNYILPQPITLTGNVIARPEPPKETYTVTIKAFDGIDVTYPGTGSYEVTEGEDITVSFDLDDRYQESDLLVMLDYSETGFQHLYGNHYSVTIRNVVSNSVLSINKKAVFIIEMPQVTGLETDPAPGIHRVGRFDSFDFSLTLEDGYDQSTITVLVNGEELAPLSVRSATHYYRIDNISEAQIIEIRGVEPNNDVANEDIHTDTPKVYTLQGMLCVELFREATTTVYAADGRITLTRRLSPGLHRLPMSAGLYIVRIEDTSRKVIVRK